MVASTSYADALDLLIFATVDPSEYFTACPFAISVVDDAAGPDVGLLKIVLLNLEEVLDPLPMQVYTAIVLLALFEVLPIRA